MAEKPRIYRTARGKYRLDIPAGERKILRSLPDQMRTLLDSDDPSLVRLFPPAYPDNPERAAEFDEMVRPQLVAGRRASLDIMERTIDARRLDMEELEAWASALNDLRLVIGTNLDVTEETFDRPLREDDPEAPALAMYLYLGWLEEQAVEALAEDLPDGDE